MNAPSGFWARTFDFFPFDMSSGPEFLVVYALLACIGVLGGKFGVSILLGLRTPLKAPERGARAEGYRHAAAQPRRLVVGTFPSIDDALHIAYLRAETKGVADAILTQAAAEGWLQQGPVPGMLSVFPLPSDASPASRELAANLHATSIAAVSASKAANVVAERKARELELDLEAMGLYHTPTTRFWGVLAYLGVAASVLGVGLVRALRGSELGRPIGFLVVMMLAVAGTFFAFRKIPKRSAHGDAYLRWITDSTVSLRQDVLSGRAQQPIDWVLAGATAGLFAVPIVAAMLPAPVAASSFFGASGGNGSMWDSYSSSSWTSSSSCSSSSCGGGGGCGSSCGGGGGCGG